MMTSTYRTGVLRVARAPLRISVIGGGTDVPEMIDQIGLGLCLTLAINRYVTAVVREDTERQELSLDDAIDTALTRASINTAVTDVKFLSDAPDRCGTGLGSSSAWMKALREASGFNDPSDPGKNFLIEREAGIMCGYQDHASAAAGYSALHTFGSHKNVRREDGREYHSITTDALSKEDVTWLSDRIRLFKIGGSRNGLDILKDQAERMRVGLRNEGSTILGAALKFVTAMKIRNHSLCVDCIEEAWYAKKSFSEHVSNDVVEAARSTAKSCGADTSKLLGAGAAGYLMTFGSPRDIATMTDKMTEAGYENVQFSAITKES